MQRYSRSEAVDDSKRKRYTGSFANDSRPTSSNDTSDFQPSSNGQWNETEQKYAPTLFDQLNAKGLRRIITYEILDWLDINSLCAFSKTCKSFQQTAKDYFDFKYPSLAIDIGDEDESKPLHFACFGNVVQHLQLSGASLDEFTFAAANVNPNLRELSFNRTNEDKKEDHIGKKHIDGIKGILENVKTICGTSSIFEKGCIEYLLMNCKRIDSFGFAARKNTTYRFEFRKVPTLKTIEIAFEAKAKVIETLKMLQKKRLQLDELVLSFSNEHSDSMNDIFNVLDAMYENGIFKCLYLNFDKKSLIADHINRLAKVKGLVGIVCAYRINNDIDTHLLDLAMLNNIKYLAIHWMFTDSTVIAQQMQELIELKVTETTIEAILPFARYAAKLGYFHIKHIQGNKILKANILNVERGKLMGYLKGKPLARKLNICIPEKIYIKMKWSSIAMKCDFVEITREESYVPKKRLPHA